MYFSARSDGHLASPTRPAYLTPKGEDEYYRQHSFTAPRPFAHLRARLASLHLHLPKALHRTSLPTAPVLK